MTRVRSYNQPRSTVRRTFSMGGTTTLSDGNKNIRRVLDASVNIVATYDYSPLGEVTAGGTLIQPWQFSSEHFDSATGLVYYNYRYYSPELGRWIKRDPIEEQGGVNLYVSMNNKITNHIDQNGLAGWWDYFDVRYVGVRDPGVNYRPRIPSGASNTRTFVPENHMFSIASLGLQFPYIIYGYYLSKIENAMKDAVRKLGICNIIANYQSSDNNTYISNSIKEGFIYRNLNVCGGTIPSEFLSWSGFDIPYTSTTIEFLSQAIVLFMATLKATPTFSVGIDSILPQGYQEHNTMPVEFRPKIEMKWLCVSSERVIWAIKYPFSQGAILGDSMSNKCARKVCCGCKVRYE